MYSVATVVLALLAPLSLPASARNVQTQIPHESLAQQLLQEAGLAGVQPASFTLEQLFERAYLRADVGLFEVLVPRNALQDQDTAENFRSVALALMDLQRCWLAWLQPALDEPALDPKEAAVLREWVAEWSLSKLATARLAEHSDVHELLGSSTELRALAERFQQRLRSGSALGLAREVEQSEPIVICPTRADFVALASLGGWMYPKHRQTFWQPAIATWAYCYIDRYKLLALELAGPEVMQGNWRSGVSMNARTPTGLVQQAAQLCANSMLDNLYGERVPPSLAGALAINLVIELYDECNTRVDGDARERRTQAREVFVPGGASEGGVLPPHLADSRWRIGGGADFFAGVLQNAQAAGAELAHDKKDKLGYFRLEDDSGSQTIAIRAPFLGGAAAPASASDEAFQWDRLEFLRSYRSCFLWWLQHESESTEKKSKEQFARLLVRMALSAEENVVDIFPKAFNGALLSSAAPSKKDLEGQFLAWLSKQNKRR